MRVRAPLVQAKAGEHAGDGLGEHGGPIIIVAEREPPMTPSDYLRRHSNGGPLFKGGRLWMR